ncbi:hypothetical protein ACVIWV_010091 [Bradyrhizobium diazoefficiens]
MKGRAIRAATVIGTFLPLVVGGHRATEADDLPHVVPDAKCDALDISDAPLRAFRSPDGSITAFATHYRNRALVGSSFGAMAKNCSVAYEGTLDPDPSHFNYKTWITATWIGDDGSVIALGHNEYQAHELVGHCRFADYSSCWYNSIVLLRSNDRGRTFHRADDLDKAVVAPDFADTLGQGHPRGYTSPTNLVKWGDYLYTLVGYSGVDKGDSGRCVLRSRLPVTTSSWEIFTRDGFVRPNQSAYEDQARVRCEYVTGMRGFVGSIAKLANSNLFVATVAEDINGGSIVAYFSDDLVHWHDRQVLEQVPLFWSKDCSIGKRFSYPSLIDENSPGPNFDQVGRTPTLYLVQGGCEIGSDLALVKTKVKIKPPSEAH